MGRGGHFFASLENGKHKDFLVEYIPNTHGSRCRTSLPQIGSLCCPDSLGGLTRKYLLNKDKMLEEEDVYIQLVLPRLLLITVSSSLII